MLSIKSILKKAASFLHGSGSIYDSTPLTFPQINVERVKIKLNLLEEAKNRGSKNLPHINAKNPDDVEQSIVGFINEQIRDCSESFADYQRAFSDRINRLKAVGHAERLDEIADAAVNDFNALVRHSSIEIHTAKKDVEEIEKYFDEFKIANQINRPAIYPHNRLFNYSLLFFILVAETAMNASFFAKGSEFGWIGGIATAILPSIVNMMFAYFLGNFAFRLVISASKIKKLSGVLLIILLPLIIFLINLGLAHYRGAYIIGEQSAARIALENLISTPLNLGDIESWLLLLVGCLCSLISSLDIWSMDDKYPGYGKLARRKDIKIEDYEYMIASSLEELRSERDSRLEELEVVYSEVSSKEGEAIVIFDHQKRWAHRFSDYLEHLESVGRTLISFYRNKNCEFRSDNPPKYFDQDWSLKTTDPKFNLDEDLNLDDFRSDPLKVKKLYKNCIARINQTYSDALHKFSTIDEIKIKEMSINNDAHELETETVKT